MVKSRSWSAEEDAVLREIYPTEPLGALTLRLPGRTSEAISHRARRLSIQRPMSVVGIAGNRPGATGGPFTDEEEQQFRRLYPSAPAEELIAAFPERTWSSLRSKARKLGLKRDPNMRRREYGTNGTIGRLSEADRGYLAGVVDGEGCFHLRKLFPPKREGGLTTYGLVISITNTDLELIEWLNQRIPTSVATTIASERNRQTKTRFQWVLTGTARTTAFCRDLAPYLIVKREEAELLARGWLHLSEGERAALFLRMRELKRGEPVDRLSAK